MLPKGMGVGKLKSCTSFPGSWKNSPGVIGNAQDYMKNKMKENKNVNS